ncbi:MAG: hypothetical protein R3F39_03055 [Myxococcota bacterium]
MGDALAAHRREVLTVVGICYAPVVAVNVLLTATGSLPTAETAAKMTVGSGEWWATVSVALIGVAGLSFGVGAALHVVLRALNPQAAVGASLRRWGGVLSLNLAGFLSIFGLAIPAGILFAVAGAALGRTTPETMMPVMYGVGVVMLVPVVRTLLSLTTAFALMTAEGLRLRPALVRAGVLLKGNRLVGALFFGGIVLVATGFPTTAVYGAGVRTDGVVAIVVLSLIYVVAISVEAVALAVMYRALVGRELGASDGKLAEVFE